MLGTNGWLAQNASTNAFAGFICQLAPAVETTPRLDVHFWWNVGEVLLLALAAHVALRHRALEPTPDLLEMLLLKR